MSIVIHLLLLNNNGTEIQVLIFRVLKIVIVIFLYQTV